MPCPLLEGNSKRMGGMVRDFSDRVGHASAWLSLVLMWAEYSLGSGSEGMSCQERPQKPAGTTWKAVSSKEQSSWAKEGLGDGEWALILPYCFPLFQLWLTAIPPQAKVILGKPQWALGPGCLLGQRVPREQRTWGTGTPLDYQVLGNAQSQE